MAEKMLGERLIEAGLLTLEQLEIALEEQRRAPALLGIKLITLGFVSETDLLLVLSAQLRRPAAQLDGRRVPADVVAQVPLALADQYHCLPLFLRGEGPQRQLFLAMADPTDLAAVRDIEFRLTCRVQPVLALHGQLIDAIDRHYRGKPSPGDVVARDMDAFLPEIDLEEPHAEAAGSAGELELEPEPRFQPEHAAPAADPVLGAEREPEPPAAGRSPQVRVTDLEPAGQPASSRAVLRALIELLIEREVLGPHDIRDRLARLARVRGPREDS